MKTQITSLLKDAKLQWLAEFEDDRAFPEFWRAWYRYYWPIVSKDSQRRIRQIFVGSTRTKDESA